MNPDLKPDLVFAKVVGEQIDEYVHVEVLYYPIGAVAGMQMPQLTIGIWLEALWRLKTFAAALSAAQQATVDEALACVQRVRSRAPELYKQKARREFKSRLDTWTWYLDEILGRPESRLDRSDSAPPEGQAYATQVHVRFKLELLNGDVSQLQEQVTRLRVNDRRLQTRFAPGSFIWDAELAPYLPADAYWWLYGRPA
ncbi:MAG: hypothetical protein M1434_14820 [Chloroflexi bacterium]|nr:hypothetical protein [Chloroflexota bacterium]MCL5275992.1 hypothetical protein [Chloroflexota bacterium]